jgi:hypothetical protein
VPPVQGSGRFDLGASLVLYLAESPAHAVGEVMQAFRGCLVGATHLRRFGKALAVVEVKLPREVPGRLADLTDPAILSSLGIRPDALASRDVQRTQSISRSLFRAGYPGFRWWSSLMGDWHTVVLFLDRVPVSDLSFGKPQALSLAHPAMQSAASLLGFRLDR